MSPLNTNIYLCVTLVFIATGTAFFACLASPLPSGALQQYTLLQEVHTGLWRPVI